MAQVGRDERLLAQANTGWKRRRLIIDLARVFHSWPVLAAANTGGGKNLR
jgi:hypothetical protein